MTRTLLPKGRAAKAFAGVVAGTVALTFGIAAKGLFTGGDPSGQGTEAEPAAKAEPAAPEITTSQSEPATPPQSVAPAARGMETVPAHGVRRVLKIDGPLRHGVYVWDEEGVPPGPVVITVDLKAETLSVFRGGYEIGVAVILYGATDKPSPLGVFPITQKDADHVSNLYDDAPMPYALRLTQDGVFIHGSDVDWGRATHGCIGVPTPFAEKLFGVVKLGDKVIITEGKMMELG